MTEIMRMRDRHFIDSNIWVYLFASGDERKTAIAGECISTRSGTVTMVISHQVLNEVCNVLKKRGFSETRLKEITAMMFCMCEVEPYTDTIFHKAFDLRDIYSLSYWDSQIVATAVVSQCTVLVSEDMQDRQMLGNVLVRNVFRDQS